MKKYISLLLISVVFLSAHSQLAILKSIGKTSNQNKLGLKYENDIAAGGHKLQSIGFRISYSFSFLRRNRG